MKKHLNELKILKYAMGLLTEPRILETKHQLDECLVCNANYARFKDEVEHNRESVQEFVDDLREECTLVEPMLAPYRDRKLSDDMDKFVHQHLTKKICDQCNLKYYELVEEKEVEQMRQEEGRPQKDCIYINEINDYIKQTSLYKSNRNSPGKLSTKAFPFEVARKDILIEVRQSGQGVYAVKLQSDKYDVSGVTVSLGRLQKTEFQPLITEKTSVRGNATLKENKELPDPRGRDRYALCLSGLKRKVK